MKRIIAFSSVGILAILAGSADRVQGAEAQTYSFRSERKPGSLDHVLFSWEIGGELIEKQKAGAKPDAIPMSGLCDADYVEKTLAVPGPAAPGWRSVRCYQKAAAVNKRAKDVFKLALRPERFLVLVDAAPPRVTLFSPRGALSRDEIEVTDVVGNSLVLDAVLLPEKPVAVGDNWKLPDDIAALLFGLQSLSRGGVECNLKEVTATVARFELAGKIEGAYNDTAPSLEVKGKYRFDLRTRRIDWLGLLVKIQQEPGEVDAGMDTTARVEVRVTPQEACEALSDAALGDLDLRPGAEFDPVKLRVGGRRMGVDARPPLAPAR